MGCDIHAFIECESPYGEYYMWAEVNIKRDYRLFSLLAGVRGKTKHSLEQKGFPSDAGWEVKDKYYLTVTDDFADNEGCISSEQANYQVLNGYAEYVGERKDKITNSDFHSASWVNVKELFKVKGMYIGISKDILAVYAAMKELTNARLVFWFDN